MSNPVQDTIEREITVRAPKERVFKAIIDPAQIVKWFPDAVEGSFDEGERPIFDFGKYGKYRILIIANRPHDYFAYKWTPGSYYLPDGFLGDVLTVPHTFVEFFLNDCPEGTLVKLKESGFASLPAEQIEVSLKDNNEGWDYMMASLAKFLAEA